MYGVWARDLKPLLFVVPLALVKPVLYAVSVLPSPVGYRADYHGHQYENVNYTPAQAGPPFGCVLSYGISDHTLAT